MDVVEIHLRCILPLRLPIRCLNGYILPFSDPQSFSYKEGEEEEEEGDDDDDDGDNDGEEEEEKIEMYRYSVLHCCGLCIVVSVVEN